MGYRQGTSSYLLHKLRRRDREVPGQLVTDGRHIVQLERVSRHLRPGSVRVRDRKCLPVVTVASRILNSVRFKRKEVGSVRVERECRCSS